MNYLTSGLQLIITPKWDVKGGVETNEGMGVEIKTERLLYSAVCVSSSSASDRPHRSIFIQSHHHKQNNGR